MSVFGVVVLIIVLVLVINNTAGEYVRRDNERREWQHTLDKQEAANFAHENEKLKNDVLSATKKDLSIDRNYITDAEIIDD